MNLNDNAISLLRQRYCRNGEQPVDVFKRTANAIGSITNGSNKTKEFLNVMEGLDFLPNSPCLFNAGISDQLKACFVMGIEDSMESIFKTLYQSALIFKSGGGVGYNFSKLREIGAPLSHGGTSSGAISFMKIYDSITEAIKQGGARRGASMGVLEYTHPEIIKFIQSKGKYGTLTNFNVSVLVDNDFMKRVDTDDEVHLVSRIDRRHAVRTLKARDIFWLISIYAWDNGDPGMLFYENINRDNHYPEPIDCCNPCGEQFLHPYESCCLGSINLKNHVIDNDINTEKLIQTIETGTQFLMAINKRCQFPIQECFVAQGKYPRIGLGVMGFADMLMDMHVKYDSKEALNIIDKVGRALQKTHKLFPQAASTLSIAPTGSLSIIANCSSGIEPIFSNNYERRVTAGVFKESRNHEYLRTAHEVTPEWHLKVLARWQKWIDNGVSKTINLPHEASQSDVADVYKSAWKLGCKGVTVFRDGCRDQQVYNTAPAKGKCDGESCSL